jgi:hypothetical protein
MGAKVENLPECLRQILRLPEPGTGGRCFANYSKVCEDKASSSSLQAVTARGTAEAVVSA